MKIGIITFWWAQDNYGQLLQCYALQKYLRNLGHDAFLIRYDSFSEILVNEKKTLWKKVYKVVNPISVYRFITYRLIDKRKLQAENINHPRSFDKFRERYICQTQAIYKTYDELKHNPPDADCYIVGSDQVWNPDCIGKFKNEIYKAYFLDFGKQSSKKIAYAASWGRTVLSENEKEKITSLLEKFDYVSVREKSGVELCKKCGYENVKWVCDPTLLLEAEKYRQLYKENKEIVPHKEYVFFYYLNNSCVFDKQAVYNFAHTKNLEVIYITGNYTVDKYPKNYPTIQQWLSLIDNAKYIITNSFHGALFSILFNKNFGVIPLNKKCIQMNSRMESLFEMFGIEQRLVDECDFSVLEHGYECRKNEVIEWSKEFIENFLEHSK